MARVLLRGRAFFFLCAGEAGDRKMVVFCFRFYPGRRVLFDYSGESLRGDGYWVLLVGPPQALAQRNIYLFFRKYTCHFRSPKGPLRYPTTPLC